jgi:hypothetical protein
VRRRAACSHLLVAAQVVRHIITKMKGDDYPLQRTVLLMQGEATILLRFGRAVQVG